MSRTWEDNAVEFGALSKQGVDVRLAVLVATSVEKAPGRVANATLDPKVNATNFAEKASTTATRVLRHLDAWVKCAAEGWCEVPKGLKPEDALNPDLKVPTEEQFKSKFDASTSGGRPRASVKEIVTRAAKDPEYAEELTREVAKAAPKAVATAVAKNPEATAGYAEVRKEEADERIKAADISIEKSKPTASTKAMAASVASRNAVSDWLILVHEAGAKLRAAEKVWSKIEADIIAEDLTEANASLVEAEGDVVILRQRIADKMTSLSTSV